MKYKLKKDLPDVKAGAIGNEDKYGYYVFGDIGFLAKIVENNPEWFEEVSEFKVGDIVVILKDYKVDEPITKINKIEKEDEYFYYTDYSGIGFNNKAIRLATNEEIIQYYKNQGWVKGAKFKCVDGIKTLSKENTVYIGNYGDIVINSTEYKQYYIKDCELIKEPELPKKWEDLGKVTGYYINTHGCTFPYVGEVSEFDERDKDIWATEKQAKSALAFAQLSQLVKVMNGDWIPDWSDTNESKKYFIERLNNNLLVESYYNIYRPLVFSTKELAEFSLKHHRELWEQYYEI